MKLASATRLRAASQVVFLLLFLFLLLRTDFRAAPSGASDDLHLSSPVKFFFQIDPLVGISNALASRALYHGLLWSLLILIPTFFLGRFFCGWICPMGTLNHFFGSLKSESKRGKQLIESNRYKRWQTTKYYILIVVLLAAVFGTAIVGWLDPFSLLTRSIGLSIFPSLSYLSNAVLRAGETSQFSPLAFVAGIVHAILNLTVLSLKQSHFRQGFFLGLIFIFLLALNLRVTRFFCRALCPLGALFGLVSRWSILGLQKHPVSCDNCNRCLLRCQGGDDPIGGVPWRKSECHLCLNCVGECPHHGLEFKFFPSGDTLEAPNLPRRRVLTGIAAGAAVVPLLRATPVFSAEKNEHRVRPPGALEESDFLARCVRCGECMKVCPNNALHPAFSEAGLEGVWTPVLVARIGYCEPSCTLCSEACPTGAIWKITAKEKAWSVGVSSDSKPIRIGTAFYDRGRCLPWAMAIDCIVCEEWCPTSPKAIYLQPAEVIDANAQTKVVKQPRVDPARCVGCGACEYACPLQDHPAVYITSIGESRSSTNQILLNQRKKAKRS
ncbi:MAG TPA: 4Fe-4S dicluster domain-containing protein [Candidatus Saccharimonadales bacterium]|nr:4Fe-4S dicluster domain-containing protein [Candidatus Saccharimonadales bacterium]